MKQSEIVNMTKAERIFIGVLAVVVLFILPLAGPDVMLLGAGIALLTYAFLFKEHIRKRGWLMSVVPLALAAALAAVIAAILTWMR